LAHKTRPEPTPPPDDGIKSRLGVRKLEFDFSTYADICLGVFSKDGAGISFGFVDATMGELGFAGGIWGDGDGRANFGELKDSAVTGPGLPPKPADNSPRFWDNGVGLVMIAN
jgi:hypothetical protein